MARRNPRNGRKRGRQAPAPDNVLSSDGASLPTSDSDFSIDDEEALEQALPLPDILNIPAAAPAPAPPPRRKKKCLRRRGTKEDEKEIRQWQIWEKENDEWVDEAEKAVKEDVEEYLVETVNPSPDILLPLLRFQKEWLAWALKQEASEIRGGILADEMGMGKTIQAISLVLTARALPPPSLPEAPSCLSSSPLPRTRCTLVICPVVAMIQWAGEIARHTKMGSARVLMFHGAKRSNVVYNFDNYDFVLTTYSTIEYDYRKNIMPPKERCEWCGRMLYPKNMAIHRRYYCGPNAQMTEKQSKQTKKKQKVKASNLKEGLLLESGEDKKGKGKKGGGRKKGKQNQPSGGIEMAENQGVSASNTDGLVSGKSLLHSVIWDRIILDEAHFVKDRRCNTARAVFALESSYKWALSGTPLQNRVGELYSLVRFLQIPPYSFYFCKNCDCKILDYGNGYSKNCANCPHSTVRHFCWWNRYITKPMQEGNSRRAMILLKERVLRSLVLRRTKKGRAADLALPPRIVTLRRDSLDKNEQEFYEALYTQSQVQFDTYVSAGTLMNNYAHIFDLLTRLRQAVDHPYLVIYSRTAEAPNVSTDDSVKDDCGICHDPAEDMVVTSCEHVFCKACLIDYSAALGNASCPSCTKPLTVDLTTKSSSGEKTSKTTIKGYRHSSILNRIHLSDFKTSTKIDALREEIRDMVEADRTAKGIVFSQFTSFLDLINYSLQISGVKCVQLVGSMSLAERERAIKIFTDDPNCRIFLMSLKAGGVALNLTVASHVFLMDPWWNPAVERQAQDRIHRIGQYKPIRTVRFVIEDTVEERILKLQDKKELVFEGTIGNSPEAMAKLTAADLRFLFQI